MKTKIALLVAALALVGCLSPSGSSAKTNYYRLSAADLSDVTQNVEPIDASVLVKVRVPKELDTPRMAYVDGEFEIAYKETARWASSLSGEIAGVVAEGLEPYFEEVKELPIALGEHPDYRLELLVESAWATEEGDVVLDIDWQYYDAQRNLLATGDEKVSQSGWKAGDFRSMAQKMSLAASTIAKNIAEKIYSLDAASK